RRRCDDEVRATWRFVLVEGGQDRVGKGRSAAHIVGHSKVPRTERNTAWANTPLGLLTVKIGSVTEAARAREARGINLDYYAAGPSRRNRPIASSRPASFSSASCPRSTEAGSFKRPTRTSAAICLAASPNRPSCRATSSRTS